MIVIALGANLPSHAGEAAATLKAALQMLARRGVQIKQVSQFYSSPAWPDPKDPPFVNAAARIETALTPRALLALLHEVETEFGRKRSVRNAPRSLDLDIIDYDGRMEEGSPTLPHPRMESRAFVLVPLAEIAPGWRHPVSGRTVEEMIAALPAEKGEIRRLGY